MSTAGTNMDSSCNWARIVDGDTIRGSRRAKAGLVTRFNGHIVGFPGNERAIPRNDWNQTHLKLYINMIECKTN